MYVSDAESSSERLEHLAVYVSMVYRVLGRERIQTVLDIALGLAVPLASNDILLQAVAIFVLSVIKQLRGGAYVARRRKDVDSSNTTKKAT
jgi:hypothetical protein